MHTHTQAHCVLYVADSPDWSVFSEEEAEEEVKLSELSVSLRWEGVAGVGMVGMKGVSGVETNSWESIPPPTESGGESLAGREKESRKHWKLHVHQRTSDCMFAQQH